MILSFHPCFEADTNIIVAGRDPGHAELAAIRAARAVILPMGCRKTLYQMAVTNCPHVFPDYRTRFAYPGKTGQADLFKELNAPFPLTRVYRNLAVYQQETAGRTDRPPLPLPFVFKLDWGGEGKTVFLINNEQSLSQAIDITEKYENSGLHGFLVQTYVPHQNRSLRVVVVHRKMVSYWRVQGDGDSFGTSLAAGARIDHDLDPQLQAQARKTVRHLCDQTGINLAGFDVIFDQSQPEPHPTLLEINYFFGRVGLGGSDAFYRLLIPQIRRWLSSLDAG